MLATANAMYHLTNSFADIHSVRDTQRMILHIYLPSLPFCVAILGVLLAPTIVQERKKVTVCSSVLCKSLVPNYLAQYSVLFPVWSAPVESIR